MTLQIVSHSRKVQGCLLLIATINSDKHVPAMNKRRAWAYKNENKGHLRSPAGERTAQNPSMAGFSHCLQSGADGGGRASMMLEQRRHRTRLASSEVERSESG